MLRHFQTGFWGPLRKTFIIFHLVEATDLSAQLSAAASGGRNVETFSLNEPPLWAVDVDEAVKWVVDANMLWLAWLLVAVIIFDSEAVGPSGDSTLSTARFGIEWPANQATRRASSSSPDPICSHKSLFFFFDSLRS